jgi:hypothetical protein
MNLGESMSLASTLRGVVNRVEEKVDELDLLAGVVASGAGSVLLVAKEHLSNLDSKLANYDNSRVENVNVTEDLAEDDKVDNDSYMLKRVIKAADARFGRDNHFWRSVKLDTKAARDEVKKHFINIMSQSDGWNHGHLYG